MAPKEKKKRQKKREKREKRKKKKRKEKERKEKREKRKKREQVKKKIQLSKKSFVGPLRSGCVLLHTFLFEPAHTN